MESESAMVKQAGKPKRAKAMPKSKRRQKPEILDEEEQLLREAFTYLLFNHGMFLVSTAIRVMQIKGFPVWIITVTWQYGAGDEAYIGDLLYDGEVFTFLTEKSVRDERAQKLLDDPERIRKWNES